VLTADSHQAALHILDERALYPLEIKEGVTESAGALFGKKVKLSQLSTAYNQLADLLRAGVPVLRALDLLCRQNAHPAMTAVMRVVRDDVAGGRSRMRTRRWRTSRIRRRARRPPSRTPDPT
jgi:general secretion pathway protein F/type IV pilus assembly protein PilC